MFRSGNPIRATTGPACRTCRSSRSVHSSRTGTSQIVRTLSPAEAGSPPLRARDRCTHDMVVGLFDAIPGGCTGLGDRAAQFAARGCHDQSKEAAFVAARHAGLTAIEQAGRVPGEHVGGCRFGEHQVDQPGISLELFVAYDRADAQNQRRRVFCDTLSTPFLEPIGIAARRAVVDARRSAEVGDRRRTVVSVVRPCNRSARRPPAPAVCQQSTRPTDHADRRRTRSPRGIHPSVATASVPRPSGSQAAFWLKSSSYHRLEIPAMRAETTP